MKYFELLSTRTKYLNKINNQDKILYFPLIDIKKYHLECFLNKIYKIKSINIFIFISKNAIECIMPIIKKNFEHYKRFKYISIGNSSAKEIQKYGIKNIYYSNSKYPNSNEILKLKILKEVKNKKIIIFKGNDGNRLLYDILRKRQAIVHNVISYKREKPSLEKNIFPIKNNVFKFTLITSVENLKNFFFFMNSFTYSKIFFYKYIIVTSYKIKKMARFLGFRHIILSNTYKETEILVNIKK